MHNAWLDRHAFQLEPAGERACFAYRAIVIGVVVAIASADSFHAQFQQSYDAAHADSTPANAGAAEQKPANPSSPRSTSSRGGAATKDPKAAKAPSIRINLSAVAPANAPAGPPASLPLRLQLTPDGSPDEGSAGNRPAPQAAGGQADAISPEQMPSLSAIPAGNLAFSLKMKPEAPVTPAGAGRACCDCQAGSSGCGAGGGERLGKGSVE